MKNRIILISEILAFMLFTGLYSAGFFEFSSKKETLSGNTWHPAVNASAAHPDGPNAGNVSSSYYDKIYRLELNLLSNPGDTARILQLANLYQEGHQPAKAAGWYEEYIRLVPDDIQALLDLANTYGDSGRWEKALRVTEQLLSIEPGNGKALYNKAAIHANMGNLEDARIIWEGIVSRDEDAEITLKSRNALDKLSRM